MPTNQQMFWDMPSSMPQVSKAVLVCTASHAALCFLQLDFDAFTNSPRFLSNLQILRYFLETDNSRLIMLLSWALLCLKEYLISRAVPASIQQAAASGISSSFNRLHHSSKRTTEQRRMRHMRTRTERRKRGWYIWVKEGRKEERREGRKGGRRKGSEWKRAKLGTMSKNREMEKRTRQRRQRKKK